MNPPKRLKGAAVLPPMNAAKKPAATPSKPKRSAGRWQTLNSFVDVAMRDLPRGDVAVWLVLFRDTREGTARTSQADIATRTGMSVRGVAKALARLEQRSLVKVVFQGGLNRGPTRYRVATTEELISSSD